MSDAPVVLIVDDVEDLRELRAVNFQSAGFETVTVADGADALEHLKTADPLPTVILIELLLPEVDGLEFLRQRAATDGLDAIPTIILTGVDDEETVAEAFELGADDYVTKPFSPKALIARVEHLG